MAEPVSKLEVVLWNLLEEYLEGDADELTAAEAERVGRIIRDTLEIDDAPSSREPGEIADFIYWNCESLSRDGAERWLNSLTEKQLASLEFGDVLSALAPGLAGDIRALGGDRNGYWVLAGALERHGVQDHPRPGRSAGGIIRPRDR